jgi:hypothetical protein
MLFEYHSESSNGNHSPLANHSEPRTNEYLDLVLRLVDVSDTDSDTDSDEYDVKRPAMWKVRVIVQVGSTL